MNAPSQATVKSKTHATYLIGFGVAGCVLLEAILFFGLFTDYSWNSILANILYPLLVGFLCFLVFIATMIIGPRKWLMGLCLWPGIIYGLIQLTVIILAILPPFMLATMFWADEELDGSIVQRSVSPDGSKTALVSYKPTGAYTSGLGRADIQLTYKYLPFVKRDLYNLGKTDSDESRTNWIEWRGNAALYLICERQSIHVGLVKSQPPMVPVLLFFSVVLIFRFLFDEAFGV